MLLSLLATALANPAPPPHGNFLYPYRYGDIALLLDPSGQFMDGVVAASAFGDAQASEDWLVRELYEAFFGFHDPLEYDFLIVVTSDHFGSGGAFYAPLANDVQGIGKPALANGDGPDGDPKGGLQGVVFLNAAHVWLENEAAGRYVFGNTIGQRWCGGAGVDVEGVSADALQSGHGSWSYWLNTSNSPCGGNEWVFTGGDTMSAYNSAPSAFSELDLYVMGLLAPEEVPDLELMVVAEDEQARVGRDAASRPEYLTLVGLTKDETITVSTTVQSLTVDDIIAAEGPRLPAAADSQRAFRAAFVYLSLEGDAVDVEVLERVDALRLKYEAWWAEDVRSLASLDTTLGASLAEVVTFPGGGDTGDTGVVDTGDTGDTGLADTGDTGDTGGTGETSAPEDTEAPPEDTEPVADESPPSTADEPACSCAQPGLVFSGPWVLLGTLLISRRRRTLSGATP